MVLTSITWGLSSTPMGSGGLLKFSLRALRPCWAVAESGSTTAMLCLAVEPPDPDLSPRTDWLASFRPSFITVVLPENHWAWSKLWWKTIKKTEAYNPRTVKLFHSDNSLCPICHPLSGVAFKVLAVPSCFTHPHIFPCLPVLWSTCTSLAAVFELVTCH